MRAEAAPPRRAYTPEINSSLDKHHGPHRAAPCESTGSTGSPVAIAVCACVLRSVDADAHISARAQSLPHLPQRAAHELSPMVRCVFEAANGVLSATHGVLSTAVHHVLDTPELQMAIIAAVFNMFVFSVSGPMVCSDSHARVSDIRNWTLPKNTHVLWRKISPNVVFIFSPARVIIPRKSATDECFEARFSFHDASLCTINVRSQNIPTGCTVSAMQWTVSS